MSYNANVNRRQLLPSDTTSTEPAACSPVTLPSHGILSFADSVITLATDVVFQPACTGTDTQGIIPVTIAQDPFYASTIPQTYVIAATTVIAWVLVVMLIITPRTTFIGTVGASASLSSGRGIIGGATGGTTDFIGVGSRPWLQKAAALTVAVSLLIATADDIQLAREQYYIGYMDATALRTAVLGSPEIRITRVISDVFVWLAQVQTLIRLFPRHKEKVLIKWIGFALILFDTTFSCLNAFLVNDSYTRPKHFVDAIPALSYLFELALGLLYAAWVIYYALTKRRYAFYHPKMRNICLIALLSLIAILTPVVFFITDVSNQDVAGWGDYFRWVGGAAASVVVWEWVERIEALERDEKKDGILGREVFDGDEMLDVTPSEEMVWNQKKMGRNQFRRGGGGDGQGTQASALEQGTLSGIAQRFRHEQRQPVQHFPLGRAHTPINTTPTDAGHVGRQQGRIAFHDLPRPDDNATRRSGVGGLTPPPVIASPVSRGDTSSAASTIYVVRYDDAPSTPQPVRRRTEANGNVTSRGARRAEQQERSSSEAEKEAVEDESQLHRPREHRIWDAVPNPFKRKRTSPPTVVQQAQPQTQQSANINHNPSRRDITSRLTGFATSATDKLRSKNTSTRQDVADLPVTIIPAQPRGSGRTWSPEIHRQQTSTPQPRGRTTDPSESPPSGSTTLTADSDELGGAGAANGVDDSTNGAAAPTTSTAEASRIRPSHHLPQAEDRSAVDNRSSNVTVVPAPRRSPLRISTPASEATPNVRESRGDG